MVLDDAWNRTTQESGHAGVLPVHIAALALGVINCLLNGLICVAFQSNRRLLTRCHLYIFYAFAITNCFSGFFTIPTLINLFVHNNLNCPRWTIIIGSGFEIGLDRMRKVLAVMIALERTFAVYCPSRYYVSDHFGFVKNACAVGIIWGSIDSVAMILENDLATIRMHCVTTSSSGYIFHTYFLISSLGFDVALVVVYAFFIVKLCMMSESVTITQSRVNANAMSKNYRQANSLTVMVVLSVILFSAVPCALYFHDLIEKKAGPVVTIGYHLYGCTSFFLYSWRHRGIRAAMMYAYFRFHTV
ncbi:unnamed protein product [Toxocara canis]|uniref:G_PROTEIN_RECEP_F1_2 domain-containing protein n=1 Tax=Toxocara canis TaxID=6265 RepID=A0A183USM3_TOXCA|nr:unnamed protein product [Toxocara canis]